MKRVYFYVDEFPFDMLKSALASDKVKSFCCSFLWNNLDVPHPSLRLFFMSSS